MFERRYLVFEDGSYYEGYKLGSDRLSIGEIVFNTAMTGYQETISRSIIYWSNCYIYLSFNWKLWY